MKLQNKIIIITFFVIFPMYGLLAMSKSEDPQVKKWYKITEAILGFVFAFGYTYLFYKLCNR